MRRGDRGCAVALGNLAPGRGVASTVGVNPLRNYIAEGSPMPAPRTLAARVLAASFVVTACSARGGSPGMSPIPAGQGHASAGAGAVGIGTANSQSLGTFLTGANA